MEPLKEVTISGLYTGNDRGIIIGGKYFTPKNVLKTDVTEDVFLHLQMAEKNGWFKIYEDNYSEYLKSRGRTIVEAAIKEAVKEETPVVEETSEEEWPVPIEETPVVETTSEEEWPVPIEETPVVETTSKEDTPVNLEEFKTMSTRAQNSALKNNMVEDGVDDYILSHRDEFKESTVRIVEESL